MMGGDFDHRPLRLQLSINYSFVEPQHTVVTNITLIELFQALKKTTKEQGCRFGWYES
jgi:hypothetical protein